MEKKPDTLPSGSGSFNNSDNIKKTLNTSSTTKTTPIV
jgi:hypothetical protein